ncbi:uncharacterized protein LOC123703229 [Colias croceus]|uniref:uncharacterized protein LOC123703229 n=1 Tax=Colias crocea TaxID=72248 RepID=UPI001E27A4A0|nr:uncharacterized protein LOC123703229 [Colias croceus]
MKTHRKLSTVGIMRKYYQLILFVVCFLSIVTLLMYRHEYYKLRYVLEVLNIFGKPGLSEIEFCGPGFNATMLSEILRNSSMEVKETPPLFQEIDENFYSYSSFLRSYQKYEELTPQHAHVVDTIVIGKAHVSPNFRCYIWLENESKPKSGRFTYKIVSEPINNFRLYVFECSMNKNFGKPKGVSFFINDYNVNPIHAPINRLIQVNTKRKVRERSNIRFVNTVVPAICVIPNQIPIVSRDAFIEFLVFHHMVGVDYFTIYDSMISEDVIRRLNLFPNDITQWNIQFYPLNYPFIFSKSYDIVRNAIELDCLFRHFRFDKEEVNKVSHVAVLSWDEFLVPRVHTSLQALLRDYDPMLTIRSSKVESLIFCLNQNDDDNIDMGYPDIMKKTHYYNVPIEKTQIAIRNLDTMISFEDIFNITTNVKRITLDMLATHKYMTCSDPKKFNMNGYNESEMQIFQHKFEGAMMKFSDRLVSDKIYRLYTSGQIWEKNNNENVRDML